MDNKMLIEFLGKTGEKIIANMLNEEGRKVQYALNNFDSEKDFLIDDNITVEVKTQQPYVLKNAFVIKHTQLHKCRSVNELYFISVPPLFKKDYKWGGIIFKVNPSKFITKQYTSKNGIKMIEIPIEQESVEIIRKLTNEELNELSKYTTSAYFNGKIKG